MATQSLRIAIIGCGTAGPAAATLLSRQGHEVVLFERAEKCMPVGAGFLLQPSGMVVLKELGILDEVLAHAGRVDRLHVLDRGGKTLLDLNYSELGEGNFGAGLHRPVLLHHLLEAMRCAGTELKWGWEIEFAERVDQKWRLRSTSGDEAEGFDLLVIADGARSKLRDLAGIGGVNRGYEWGAHWFIGKNNGIFPENELYQIVDGTRKLGGFLATGRDLSGGDPLVSLFWSIKVSDDAAWRKRPIEEWKAEILHLCPRAADFLQQIGSWDDVLTARYGDVRMKRWHGEGVVVLGDAAHAMSPQLGQGVNLALADASSLAACIDRFPISSALARYQRHRWIALRYYQVATRWLTPWFQSDHEWLNPVRKLFFGVSRKIAWARIIMTMTMAGKIGNRRNPGK